jgi:hypothetical protein
MRSPGGEGDPGTVSPTNDGQDIGRRGGGHSEPKGQKRPIKKNDDRQGPQKKKPRRRTKMPRRKKTNKKDGDDDDDEGNESDSGPESTPSRSGTSSTTPPSRPSKGTSTPTPEDDDEEDGCGQPGDKAYFTFILHYNNLSETWKTAVAGRRKGCPSFISFDHGDHIHVLFGCSGGGGNATRTRGRITRFLSANSAGIAEAAITMKRVKYLRRFLLYCICYGIQGTNLYRSPRHPDLREVMEMFKTLFKDRDPNEVIRMAGCEPYAEKKDVKTRRLGSSKSTHLADIIISKIMETDVLSAQEWEDIIPPEFKLQLIKEFGLTVDSYIQKILRIVKSQKVGNVKSKSLSELLM